MLQLARRRRDGESKESENCSEEKRKETERDDEVKKWLRCNLYYLSQMPVK